MKRTLILPVASLLLAASVSANETAHETAHETHTGHEAPVHSETGFYAALKGLVTLGNEVDHGDATLDGSRGQGVGVEMGYKIGSGFAIEGDATFARNSVTETKCAEGECEREKAGGEYTTVSLDLVYTYHVTHHLGTFVKTGYEYETETIDQLEISGNDTGFIYAAGAEYAVGDHTAFMAEYEGTTIEGPRGNSIFAGILYHF